MSNDLTKSLDLIISSNEDTKTKTNLNDMDSLNNIDNLKILLNKLCDSNTTYNDIKNLINDSNISKENIFSDEILKNIINITQANKEIFDSNISTFITDAKNDEIILNILNNINELYLDTNRYMIVAEKISNGIIFKNSEDNKNLSIRLNNAVYNYNKIEENFINLEKSTKELEKSTKEIESKMIGQLVSLIAIFTAVAFVLFGGISSFTTLLSAFEKMSLLKIILSILGWALAFSITLYIFLWFIVCIIGKQNEFNKINKFFITIISIILCLFILISIIYPLRVEILLGIKKCFHMFTGILN